jgi:hypothetical protein
MRRIAFAVVALAFCASPARAETMLLVEGVPATYTPGQDFTFTVRVPAIPGLTAYQVNIEFSTDFDTPPLLAFATKADAGTTPHSYVFTSNSRFGYSFNNPVGGEVATLTFADPFTGSPNPSQNTVKGQNDTLATVTVKPFAELTGPITLSFTTDFQYNRSEAPVYQALEPIVIEQGSGTPDPVPAPPGAVLLGAGLLLVGARARFRRQVC